LSYTKPTVRLAAMVLGLILLSLTVSCELRTSSNEDLSLPSYPNTPTSYVQGDEPQMPRVIKRKTPLDAPSGVPKELATVWEVWSLLSREHVDRSTFNTEEFTEAAIRGMLTALGDPHTNYVDSDAFKIENEDLSGKFEGIGATVSMGPDGRLIVIAPLVGSPAEKADIRPGDTIIEVNGEPITGYSLIKSVSKIRGPKDTKVILKILRVGTGDPIIITVTRGIIPLESIVVRSNPGDTYAHIRITNFFDDTPNILKTAINEAVQNGAQGVILDVRDNPGGLLQSVIDISSLFIDDGLILYQLDGAGTQTNWDVTLNDDLLEELPLVILANSYSASASEILVGALQDHERAIFVGATTFGKGSVNVLRKLDNGGGLYLTFARWFTPNGRQIHENGLKPDVEVIDRDPVKADVSQLEKAQSILEELTAGMN